MDSNLVDIVRTIISRIDLNIAVKSIVGNKIYVCNTMHITLGKIVKDEFGNKYKVTDFSFNEWIEVIPVNPRAAYVDPIIGVFREVESCDNG